MKVISNRKEKKEGGSRESRNVMFTSSNNFGRSGFIVRKEDNRSRHTSKKIDMTKCFSLCESLKITIMQGRIAYISTYNTEIFNGAEIVR